MQRSQELFDAYTDMIQGIVDGRFPSGNDILSSSDAVSAIGTEGTEWAGREVVPALDAQWAAFRQLGVTVDTSRAEAWADGDFGFVVDTPTLSLSDGPSIQLRWTTILHKEDDRWKAVHQHASFGVPTDLEAAQAFTDAVEGATAGT